MPSCELNLTAPAGRWCTQLEGLLFALQALFLSPDSRSSQPSSSLCFIQRWHFWKPALSTDKFKLQVILWSYLYIYTEMYRVLCWFIILYLLLAIILTFFSKFRTFITPKSDACLCENFYPKDLGNHLLQ
jgi:hypothetical protein